MSRTIETMVANRVAAEKLIMTAPASGIRLKAMMSTIGETNAGVRPGHAMPQAVTVQRLQSRSRGRMNSESVRSETSER